MFLFGLVCEGRGDARIVPLLVRKALNEQHTWLADQEADAVDWRGFHEGQDHLPWRSVKELAQQNDIRVHGQFSGIHGDAVGASKAIRLM